MILIKDDPYCQREAKKYLIPAPSRECILAYIKAQKTPVTLVNLLAVWQLNVTEQQVGITRRLRAMERDGQLVFTRSKAYALPERLDLILGTVIAHREGFGFLAPEHGGKDLFIPYQQMDSLFHGDKILALPLGKNYRGKVTARVVRVLESAPKQIVGRYFIKSDIATIVPDDTRNKREIIITKEHRLDASHGQIVVAEIISRGTRHSLASAKVIEILGQTAAPGIEVNMALRNHQLPCSWSKEVLSEARQLSSSHLNICNRRDLRSLPFITIDDEHAKDFDDAIYCIKKPGGGWRLWVAIADVSYYVRLGSALDKEAIKRATSIYFPDQVVPMLPETLSNGLCSLNPDLDRLCLVCEMTVSKAGRLSSYLFYHGVINSKARLTYNQVAQLLKQDCQIAHNTQGVNQGITVDLQHLYRLYQVIKTARAQRGAIEFETEESRFIFNNQRKIATIEPLIRNDAHKMIEESMILANISAARFIKKHKAQSLFRIHEPPIEEKLIKLKEFLREFNLTITGGNKPASIDFAQLIATISARKDRALLQIVLLRTMQKAIYSPENKGHFGLSLSAYSHFTSPIRRYPDLIVHRTIKYLLCRLEKQQVNMGEHLYSATEVSTLGEHCSMAERRADEATREVTESLKCEFMQNHLDKKFNGIISSVNSFGFFVRLDDLNIDGLVHVANLNNDYYHYDPVRHMLLGKNFRHRYRLGDRVKVKVQQINLAESNIDLLLLTANNSRDKKKKNQPRYCKNNKV